MRIKLILIVAIIMCVVIPQTMAQQTNLGNGDLEIKASSTSTTPQLLLEQAGTGDASIEFNKTGVMSVFSTGIDAVDLNYKLTNTGNLTGGTASGQGDGTTLMLARPSGIIDFNNQSRARASLNHGQSILISTWTPIEFDDDFTPPVGYDQQQEFTLATPMPTPAFFVPRTQGFYQIHARTAFEYLDVVQPNPLGGFVSIAIYVNGVMYAQGNNLQWNFPSDGLGHNNAPNVSDVVWLVPGDIVDIRVWQSVENIPGMVSLATGPSQTYVSIHKDS